MKLSGGKGEGISIVDLILRWMNSGVGGGGRGQADVVGGVPGDLMAVDLMEGQRWAPLLAVEAR